MNPTWLVEVQIPFAHKELVKDIPGSKWDAERKRWMLPIDAVKSLDRICARLKVPIRFSVGKVKPLTTLFYQLVGYPWQRKTGARALHEERLPIVHEMGLGKTRTVIEALKIAPDIKTVLVVCPAIVRSVWKAELDKWWPEHPQVGAIVAGQKRKQMSKAKRADLEAAHTAPIKIVSYALLNEMDEQFDCVVLDESHRVKMPTSQQSKNVRKFTDSAKYTWELTGTIAANEPQDVWNQFDILWPGRFGSTNISGIPRKFRERYCQLEHNGYGERWFGLNPLHAEEFQERIAYLCDRVTKAEVAHLLPAFLVQQVKIDRPKKQPGATAFADFKQLQTQLDSTVAIKIAALPEWLDDTSEVTHRCVLTYHRDTVNQLTQQLCSQYNVFGITGSMTPENRNISLAKAKAASSALVIATMDSIGIGIDLTFCTQAVILELTHRPDVLLQALGRFSRLSSTVPSAVQIWCVEGTADELVAANVLRKIEAINASIVPGVGEEALQKALGADDADWLAELNAALEK